MSTDVFLPLLVVVVVGALAVAAAVAVRRGRSGRRARPLVVFGGIRSKALPPGTTIRRYSMSQPADTPFPHTPECKTPGARPEWYDRGGGVYERVCTCHKEVRYPRPRRRPDPLDPKVQRHKPTCELRQIPDIADKPEIYTPWITLKVEATYTFATCKSCNRNWYVSDAAPQPAGVS